MVKGKSTRMKGPISVRAFECVNYFGCDNDAVAAMNEDIPDGADVDYSAGFDAEKIRAHFHQVFEKAIVNKVKKEKFFAFLCWSIEVGESGKVHVQMCGQINTKTTLPRIWSYLRGTGVYEYTGVEDTEAKGSCVKIRSGGIEAAVEYCSKDEGHLGGPWTCGEIMTQGARLDLADAGKTIREAKTIKELWQDDEFDGVMAKYTQWVQKKFDITHAIVPRNLIKKEDLYDWQQELYDRAFAVPEARLITWYWSTEFNIGKGAIAKLVKSKDDENVMLLATMTNMQAHVIYLYERQNCIWFDLPRDAWIDYDFLEKLSDQTYHLSTRYNTREKFIDANIIVTTNFAPTKLLDRCIVKKVEKPVPVASLEYVDQDDED